MAYRDVERENDIEKLVAEIKEQLLCLDDRCLTPSHSYIGAMFRLLDGIREDELGR